MDIDQVVDEFFVVFTDVSAFAFFRAEDGVII